MLLLHIVDTSICSNRYVFLNALDFHVVRSFRPIQTAAFSEGGDRVVVPWYQRSGTWYSIMQSWWNLVPKTGVPVPNLYELVPITVLSMDLFGIPRTSFNF